MKFEIPFPFDERGHALTGNHATGYNRRTGKFYPRKCLVRYREDVRLLTPIVSFEKKGKIFLNVTVFAPNGRVDCDNIWKVCGDAVARAWGVNDARFNFKSLLKEIDKENPRIEIEVIQEVEEFEKETKKP